MARGTAVIASSSGGLSEIVDDGTNGFLVPPGNVEALSEKLTALLTDKRLALCMAAEAKRAASERFSEDAFLRQLFRIYDSVLLAKNRGKGKRIRSGLST